MYCMSLPQYRVKYMHLQQSSVTLPSPFHYQSHEIDIPNPFSTLLSISACLPIQQISSQQCPLPPVHFLICSDPLFHNLSSNVASAVSCSYSLPQQLVVQSSKISPSCSFPYAHKREKTPVEHCSVRYILKYYLYALIYRYLALLASVMPFFPDQSCLSSLHLVHLMCLGMWRPPAQHWPLYQLIPYQSVLMNPSLTRLWSQSQNIQWKTCFINMKIFLCTVMDCPACILYPPSNGHVHPIYVISGNFWRQENSR